MAGLAAVASPLLVALLECIIVTGMRALLQPTAWVGGQVSGAIRRCACDPTARVRLAERGRGWGSKQYVITVTTCMYFGLPTCAGMNESGQINDQPSESIGFSSGGQMLSVI